MIELDADGNIPQLKTCRVYIVAGYTDDRPFKGFNIWTDTGPMKQTDIEAYDTFQGWATDTLDATQQVANTAPPTQANEFRVALMKASYEGGSPYPRIHTGEHRRDSPEDSDNFLGWLTPTLSVTLPDPVPRILVRFRWDSDAGRVDGLFVTTREKLQAVFGRDANFGRLLGRADELKVTLQPKHFLQMSDSQTHVEYIGSRADDDLVCGVHPFRHLV